jgi:hypothetical protein
MAVGLKTFATRRAPARFRLVPRALMAVELMAFAAMIWMLQVTAWAVGFGVIYLVLVTGRGRLLNLRTGIVHTHGDQARQIFMLDYYAFFFPVSILLSAIFQPYAWLLLAMHLVAFPLTPLQMLRDGYRISRAVGQPRLQ